MRPELSTWLQQHPDLSFYLHTHPEWYITLRRTPDQWPAFKKAADEFFERTWPHKLQQIHERLGMASMLFMLMQEDQDRGS
ncbi:hypothetical protein G4V62_05120 [Bacillaceae bacterium SIJ1]|uniref:YlbE-like family protein n=1 Tax=Litoribacterium kuwaitense TaxID=1398745 RepID=UPI0013ECD63A|nr:YlbE-like family protein [Litoribacterium kuwaitense]NGP44366.1 hypothetical protein [Litoribacterium kuwaitense]